jgi:endonuclease/exonuclease/phosphatase family metal-dependent hydrolase
MNRLAGPRILAGDLNTPPSAELIRTTMPADGWIDAWGALRGDEPGPTFESDAPTIRIDYFFVSPELRERVRAVDLVRGESEDRSGPPRRPPRPGPHPGLMVR